MIISRSATAFCLMLFLSFAACQSVQTQGVPLISAEDAAPLAPPSPASGTPELSPQPAPAKAPQSKIAPDVATASTPARPAPKHSYNSVDVNGSFIALTFDDGPHPVHTPKLLDILKSKNVKATFYVIGKAVEAYPEIAKRIVADGHEIANHTWTHPSLNKIGAASVKREIDRTTEVIKRVTGVTPETMRPPYGATNAGINKRMDEEFGLKVIMWSVDPLDWKYRNSARVTDQILRKTEPGGIVLAHDIHATTVAAMPATIDGLKAKGFQFVTVKDLLAMELPKEQVQPVQQNSTNGSAQSPAPIVVTRSTVDSIQAPASQ